MSDEQAGPYSGSVPHAYRNAIFWRWAPEMPRGLPSSFVTLLYALGSAADAAGKLKFRDGKPIRIKDIAAAMKVDEKDARRYLNAAIAAGVVVVEGERARGRAALYVLAIVPRPDWGAALASLSGSRRKRDHAAPWMDEKNGGHTPELSDAKNGGHTPELLGQDDQEERGTHPRTSSGDTPPFGTGDTPPNNPGNSQEVPQEIVDVGEQPQEGRQRASPQDQFSAQDSTGFTRCRDCGSPLITLPGQTPRALCRACEHAPAKEAS